MLLQWPLFILLICIFNQSLANQEKITANKKQLSQLQQKILNIQKNLLTIEQSRNKELKQLKQTDSLINKLIKQIYQLDKKISLLETDSQQLTKNIESNKQRLQEHQQILAQQLISRYHTGQQEFIKLLLNQQNPAVFGRILNYYQYFYQARLDQIERVNNIITKLDKQQSKLLLLQQEIELQQYLKNSEKSNLELQQQQRKNLINKLSNKHQDASIELKQLKQNEQQLKNLLGSLQQAIDEAAKAKQVIKIKPSKPFKQLKRKLKWPLKGKLKNLYGHWRSVGKVKWKGNIINSPEGRHVYSIASGQVIYSDWLRGYGLLTIIDHGKGYMSLYGYSQSLLKNVGDRVAKDEVIATAGRTSGRRKAGIYFEIRYNGKATNPKRWCRYKR